MPLRSRAWRCCEPPARSRSASPALARAVARAARLRGVRRGGQPAQRRPVGRPAGRRRVRGVSNYAVGVDNVDVAPPPPARHRWATPPCPHRCHRRHRDAADPGHPASGVEGDALVRAGGFVGWSPDSCSATTSPARPSAWSAGAGRAGRARRAAGFDMTVRYSPCAVGRRVGAGDGHPLDRWAARAAFDEIVPGATFSLHVPLAPETRTWSTPACSRGCDVRAVLVERDAARGRRGGAGRGLRDG